MDIIITSDADEILDPRVLENLDWFDGYNHYVATGPAYYFKLNFKYQDDWTRESTECIFSNTQFSIMPITAILEE